MVRTKPFCMSSQLFVAMANRMIGHPASAQKILSWITACIRYCYELAKISPPAIVMIHSTRAQVSSAAVMAQVPIQKICWAATWSSGHTFASHYALTQEAQDNGGFGRAMLQSASL